MALYRQGRIPGSVYTGRGQEAVGAGAGLALGPDDVVRAAQPRARRATWRAASPSRTCSATTSAAPPARRRAATATCTSACPSAACSRSSRCSATWCPVTVGAALAFKRRGEPRVALTFFGDGAFNCGDTHEGLNLAGALDVPAVFVAQSNRVAYSTLSEKAMRNPNLAQRIEGGYSIPCARVDGTDALAVYRAVRAAVERARAPARARRRSRRVTLRLDGHAAHDDGRYMDPALLQEYGTKRDPVERLAARMLADGISADEIAALREAAVAEVAAGLAEAEAAPAPDPATCSTASTRRG